jgi:hypothetical protein
MTWPADPNESLGLISDRAANSDPKNIIPGSTQLPCSRGGELVWVAPHITADSKGREIVAVCLVCYRNDPSMWAGTPTVSPSQREYLTRRFGLNDQELDEVLEELADRAKFD